MGPFFGSYTLLHRGPKRSQGSEVATTVRSCCPRPPFWRLCVTLIPTSISQNADRHEGSARQYCHYRSRKVDNRDPSCGPPTRTTASQRCNFRLRRRRYGGTRRRTSHMVGALEHRRRAPTSTICHPGIVVTCSSWSIINQLLRRASY